MPVLVEIIIWSAKYDEDTASDIKFVNRVKRDKAGVLKEISNRLKDELPV